MSNEKNNVLQDDNDNKKKSSLTKDGSFVADNDDSIFKEIEEDFI